MGWESNLGCPKTGRYADFSDRLIALQHLDLQRLMIFLWKVLNSYEIIHEVQVYESILRACVFISKYHQFHSAYILRGVSFLAGCVSGLLYGWWG